jgi:hypothetical protein
LTYRQDFSGPNQRVRNPGVGAIQEDPQAQSFAALHSHKAHLPANMVDVIQQVQSRFVASGVALQLRDTLLNRFPEPQAHFEAFLSSALSGHKEHLGTGMPEAETRFAGGFKFFLMLPILLKLSHLRQITESRNHAQFGNGPVVTFCPTTRQLLVTHSHEPGQ